MKLKKILTVLLLAFAVGSVAYMISTEKKTESIDIKPSNSTAPASKQQDTPEDTLATVSRNEQNFSPEAESEKVKQNKQLIVYYFHGNMRCPTCHKLESYAREALETFFAEQLANNEIWWKVINVEVPENERFIKDYQLVTKSVVLSDVVNGKEVAWKNLEQIWVKVRDKNSYLEYIRDSIIKFLEEEHR